MRTVAKIALSILFALVAVWCLRQGALNLANWSNEDISGDTRRNVQVATVVMLSTGAFAVFGALYWARRIRTSELPADESTKPSRRGIVKYLACAGVPGVVCAAVWILIGLEIIPLKDQYYPYVSYPFGPPILIATILGRWISEARVFQFVFVAAVSLVYFWAVAIPAGQLSGLLPRRASTKTLWIIQYILAVLHLLWGFGFWQVLKA